MLADTTLSPEHVAARLGKLTASRIADATARIAKGWGASRANLMADLLVERMTGHQADRYVSKEMLWGIETEAQARAAYEFLHDVDVEAVGFVDHPEIAMSGASPDGSVPENGLVEFKCPNTATHIEFLLTDEIDLKYRKQMQWQMACTGAVFVDFGSFDPRLPPDLQLKVRRIKRDDKMIAELEKDAREFLAELEAKERALLALNNQEKAA